MAKRSTLLKSCSSLFGDRRGNFGIMAALLVPVLLASGGVAIDMTNMMMAKNQLQDATDAAALAAASGLVNEGLTQEQAKQLAKEFLKTQLQNAVTAGMSAEELAAIDAAFTNNTVVNITEKTAATSVGNSRTYVIDVSSKFNLPLNPLTRLLGQDSAEIATVSKSLSSTEAKNAMSLYLVLDRSGSMDGNTATVAEEYSCGTKKKPKTCKTYVKKIDALKTSASNLLAQLKTADSSATLVRTGAVSYNNAMQSPSGLAWGTTEADTYVNALTASGYTDSSAAFKKSYDSLMALNSAAALKEEAEHLAKNGQKEPQKYIVFMTDGENNYFNNKETRTSGDDSDAETDKYCTKAKDAGITVFTIAFMAPDRGKELLDACATDDTASDRYYFTAEDADELNKAFKYIGEKASAMTVRLTN